MLRTVIHDVTLAIGAGEAVALVGESGSGKSMTTRAILRMLPNGAHVEGELRYEGHSGLCPTRCGRLIQSLCEAAAAAEGFTRLELMPTLSGEPLYTGYGFRPLERLADATGGAPMPLVPMEKPVNPSLLG